MSKHKWKLTFPNMPNSKNYCRIFSSWPDYLTQIELYYSHWRDHREDGYFIEQMEDFVERSIEVRFKMNYHLEDFVKAKKVLEEAKADYIYLGNCTTAATPVSTICTAPVPTPIFPSENISYGEAYNQEKGNNPMRVTSEYNTPIASASVINPKSDEAYQREYLLSELEKLTRYSWTDPKFEQLRKLFNIGKSNEPETAEDLIEKITKGQFKLDDKKMARLKAAKADDSDYDDDCDCDYTGGPFYGIIWDGVQPDQKGYKAATDAYEKAKENTKRKIIVASPADGLQALLDLEAWLPVGKAN